MGAAILLVPVLLAAAAPAVRAADGPMKAELRCADAAADASGVATKTCLLTVDGLRLDYKASHRPSPGTAARAVERGQPFLFGCSFGRYGNGGWNIWKFLDATVATTAGSFDAISRYVLDEAFLFEEGARAIAEFRWPCDAGRTSALAVRILKLPEFDRWFFLRVSVEGEASLSGAAVSCYPGNTSGPPERERWAAGPGRAFNLHDGTAALTAVDAAAAFYNRCAQKEFGNLLVFLPEQIGAISASGTYGVLVRLSPKGGVRTVCLALGYFRGEDSAAALARFFGGESARVRRALESIDWTPRVDYAEDERTVAFIEELAAADTAVAPVLEKSGFAEARAAFAAARRRGDAAAAFRAARTLQAVKEAVLAQKLRNLR